MGDLFAGLFVDFFGGTGTFAEPPDTMVLRILGLEARPATHEEVKSAFRTRLKQVHPDVAAYEGTHLALAAAAVAVQRPEVAELAWARDVLLRKIPAPRVTDAGSPPDHIHDLSRWQPSLCAKCGGGRTDDRGWITGPRAGRFAGLCAGCARDGQNAARRAARRATKCCPSCGHWFTPPRSDGLYCSPACRQKAYRQRRRDDTTAERTTS